MDQKMHRYIRRLSRGILRNSFVHHGQPHSLHYIISSGAVLLGVTSISMDDKSTVIMESRKNTGAILTRNFIADAVEKASPAVVNVAVDSGYFASNGSGFIISPKGLVVTNAHVVAKCNRYSKIQITIADGRKLPAIIHSMDALSDLAILQIESERPISWPTVKIGSSSDLRAGEWVCALGSPFSLQNSVSAGIVSAVARHSSELGYPQKRGEFIQTDAAINSGNSGGPLINLDGEVIGINTMKVDGSVGISFAIPIDSAAQVIDQLLQKKVVTRPYLGMQMVNFSAHELGEFSRLYPDVEGGVIVKAITPGSPAHIAGLQPEDVIVEFDGCRVRSTKDLLNALGFDVGKNIKVVIKRGGREGATTLHVKTASLPSA